MFQHEPFPHSEDFIRALKLVVLAAVLLPPTVRAEDPFATPNFNRDIQPILSDRCFTCHGPDANNRQAGLRLDTREGTFGTSQSGATPVKPGDPGGSAILQRIESENEALRMPPAYLGHDRLSDKEISLVRRWIEAGAAYSVHWAFVPSAEPALPTVSDPDWVKRPLDSFVLARLDTEGLKPSLEASLETWLRRVSLDLTGLPPTLEEMDAFRREAGAGGEVAYESVVDRLLASPRYGERMAMDWLDVARYADTHGFNNDSARSMWRWRDWVINSFNSNMPYDRFITEQLAGDLLEKPTLDQLIATGFNRNHIINSEGGIIEEEYRVEYVADRVRTLGMAWFGLSLECARCHDHKFDPITQRDYYRLFAFFNRVPELGEDGRVANAAPLIQAPTEAEQERIARLSVEVADLNRDVERRGSKWRWKASAAGPARDLAKTARAATPRDADFRLVCESAQEFPDDQSAAGRLSTGVVGRACVSRGDDPLPELTEQQVELCDDGALTLTLWLNPAKAQEDAPLFSAIDYSPEPASYKYGKGVGLRLVGREIEFRLSARYPGYSITVRSEGAEIRPGQWRHVAVVYQGADDLNAMRSRASWVRMFVDGRETATRLVHDDLGLPTPGFDSTFRLGWDNGRAGARFEGRLDEIAAWPRALRPAEITNLFRGQAIPFALARKQRGKASAIEAAWLRDALWASSNKGFRTKLRELKSRRAQLLETQRNAPTLMVMREMTAPRPTYVLKRGMYNLPSDPVEPGVPEALPAPWPERAPRNRLGLARWLTQPNHPLTSRVVVNRFWQQLFGVGLVKTSEDFGFQGEPPSHPKLLDRLARGFADSGWDVKSLMKNIVLSATYRQSSDLTPESAANDPENRLLARGARFRLPAEVIRDQALALAGLLKHRVGGPSVRPYQPKGLYDGVVVGAAYPGTTWDESEGADLYRRSVYTFWKRTLPHPAMTVFDAPDREFCTTRRAITNTPLQALTLLNDPTFVEAARKLAERMIREGGATPYSRIEFGFRLAAGRSPAADERTLAEGLLSEMLQSYSEDELAAAGLLAVGASASDSDIPAPQLAAYTAIASVILNLDEVITKS